MWIETDHHGMINLDYVKRVDLAGDTDKKTFGVYLFDVDGNTYPVVDVPRFTNIGIFQGKETDQEIHVATYTFYKVIKRLIASAKERDVVTIEALYKDFAAEWYAQQKKEMAKTEQKQEEEEQPVPAEGEQAIEGDIGEAVADTVHNFSDMKQLLDAYSESYAQKFNKKPLVRYENEGKIARELVKLYPLEKLKTMLKWYFDSDEDFITKANYDMKTFKAILERTRKVGASEE
ncbi:MAG: hypothetical protein A4E57_03309 [Syntrophorhabdaceae bacterium PtaU1.Bin034]|jgi:hypothetical protein|nr:MAG: hypothetical protein A4E57_03309 [Syntrophorhabdaceae bacterium PtaU1.Bin034]